MIYTINNNYEFICTHKGGIVIRNRINEKYEFWRKNVDGNLFWLFFDKSMCYKFSHILTNKALNKIHRI